MSKFLNDPLFQLSTVIGIYTNSYGSNYLYVKAIQDTKTKEIFDLVYKGRVKDISFLVRKGEVNPNIRNDDKPLLHHALDYNQFEIAKILLHYGANLNSKDAMGRRPEDIINQKKNSVMYKDLEELSEMLRFNQLNKPIQDFIQLNKNQEEIEVDTLGYTISECECTII